MPSRYSLRKNQSTEDWSIGITLTEMSRGKRQGEKSWESCETILNFLTYTHIWNLRRKIKREWAEKIFGEIMAKN